MKQKTAIAILLGAIGLYWLRSRGQAAAPGIEGDAGAPPMPPAPPAGSKQPAWCVDPAFFAEKSEAFQGAFARAWAALGYTAGAFGDLADAQGMAHDLALYVMADVCPELPRPTARMNVPSYKAKYGEAWAGAYDTPYGWAWARLVAMPV